jgi:hypothetical protein
MRVVVRWRGDDPDPRKVFEQVQDLGIFCEGFLLNPEFSQEKNESQVSYKTKDFRDLFRFALGASLLLLGKPENFSEESVFDFDFGIIETQRLEEKIRQLEKLLTDISKRMKKTTFFPGSKMREISEDLDRQLKAYRLTQ